MHKPNLVLRNLFLDQEIWLKEHFKPGVQHIDIQLQDRVMKISRSEFFQFSPFWIKSSERALYPVAWVRTNNVSHPLRYNPEKNTLLYERYIYEIDKTITFRVIDPDKDLTVFSQWHNSKRVSVYWELEGSIDHHREYIEKNLGDPHLIPVIMEIDSEPAGYFEFYWVKEDRLGPYYDCDDYDRGFHFLIGNRKFLGIKNTDAVLKCVVHYLFLDDPRTLKVMAEPRWDNQKVLQYVDSFPVWRRIKVFDFPHKRAVLLECTRERLFAGRHL
ncbi:N2-citryl-N6-acetyl-N6-hydroxylysine synthase/acetyl CoA:N6-hydroxylysine acetyl transferase [Nitrosomonas marina]|uniref:N2-citryl-N6-acetyl-N6-hydroxylysine synthase/acetyl CoA:N6-hydroxylysine acetyl transferase n=1 Tax=Nitrosomonas marina TaxID=917 RepID=A0A1I0CL04_9PROT|nr:GNAT family N-acetyltransferase [Nitrosomonas marina]SET20316.1 N2-citryl-N6-acetyl-N6-hydroxylysine synthase/acetyl CoA:N6-hydroxylysine acetyl transferase [Nitrosomonas marina]